jgi:hypothetical protein
MASDSRTKRTPSAVVMGLNEITSLPLPMPVAQGAKVPTKVRVAPATTANLAGSRSKGRRCGLSGIAQRRFSATWRLAQLIFMIC